MIPSPTQPPASTTAVSASVAISTASETEPVSEIQRMAGSSTAMNEAWPSTLNSSSAMTMIGTVTPNRPRRRAKSTAAGAEPAGTTVRITVRCNWADMTSGYGTSQPSRRSRSFSFRPFNACA